MSAISGSDDQYALEDSASIAVIGGGPTGSFFSIFTLKMAKMVGKNYSYGLQRGWTKGIVGREKENFSI